MNGTYQPSLDFNRLSTQLERVSKLMSDGQWRTLGEITEEVPGSQTGISARLRDLRKRGKVVISRRRGDPNKGIFEYKVEN